MNQLDELDEKVIEIETINSNINAIVLRFPIIYGKYSQNSIVDMIYKDAIRNSPIELFGEGKYLRNLIYIQDAVDVIHKCIQYEPVNPFEIMNAGSSDSKTIIAIARIIKELTKSESDIVKIKRKRLKTPPFFNSRREFRH